jgi:hypothetical protein
MRKKLLWSVSLLGGIILGWWIIQGTGVIIGAQENQDDVAVDLGVWTSEARIEQAFVASEDNLCRLDFFIASYHPWTSPYVECRLFEILTEDTPETLSYQFISEHLKEVRYQRMNGWMISGHMFNRFTFAPIPDSQQKRYLLSIRSPALKKGGMWIVRTSSRKRYDRGNLFVNGAQQGRDLAFRALYSRPRMQLIRQVVTKLALQKPFPFSQPGVYYGLLGVYWAALCLLVVWLVKK